MEHLKLPRILREWDRNVDNRDYYIYKVLRSVRVASIETDQTCTRSA